MAHREPFRVQFEADGIRFIDYPYRPAVCYPSGKVTLTEMLYNFDSCLWEWVNLGATDLLDAHLGILASWRFKLSKAKFSSLYRTVIDVLFDAKEVNTEAIRAML